MKLTFEAPNAEKVTKDLNLSITAPKDTIIVPAVVLPKTDLVANLTVEEGKSDGNNLLYKVNTEPGAVLVVEKWAGDSLISSEQITVDGNVYEYKTSRDKDLDKLTFRVTDRYGNTASVECTCCKSGIREDQAS